jgi:hypothetical protein
MNSETLEASGMAQQKNPALKLPSKDVLRRLADLADVPEAQRDFYYGSIRDIVRTTCELKALSRGLTEEHGKRLLRSAVALQDGLWELTKREAKLIDTILNGKRAFLFDRISGRGVGGLQMTAYQLALLFSLLTGKPEPRFPHQGAPSRKRGKSARGRRPGSIGEPIFQNFVLHLWIYTDEAGGKLSFDNVKREGTLVKAIKMLAPYLPDGVVPQVLPEPTLRHIRKRRNELKAQYRKELEKEFEGAEN